MKPKKILMRLLIIGVVGSIFLYASCTSTEGGDTVTFYYDYQNQTDSKIDIKIYRQEFIYEVSINKGQHIIQTEKSGAIEFSPEDFILLSDSICIIFPEINKELWYRGPIETTTDNQDSSPYIISNYEHKIEGEQQVRYSYSFTQEHIDLAQPINQQPE